MIVSRSFKVLGAIAFLLAGAAAAQAESMYQPFYMAPQQPYQKAEPMSSATQMPSYTYDPKLDPQNAPYKTPAAEDLARQGVGRITLASKSGVDMGIQASEYSYHEPSIGVSLNGPKFGVTLSAFGNLGYNVFLGLDGRYALGESDYKGSGTHNGNFENLLDSRLIIRKEFVQNYYALGPFAGFGFRHLYSDDRGLSSTGTSGYRRVNNMFYLPFGVLTRFRVTNDSRLSTSLELDAVLRGLQMSMLSDVDGYADIHNKQTGGYGLRFDTMWEHQSWGVGPFVTYWDISQSNSLCSVGTSYTFCGVEPANHTLEGGIQFKYHIF